MFWDQVSFSIGTIVFCGVVVEVLLKVVGFDMHSHVLAARLPDLPVGAPTASLESSSGALWDRALAGHALGGSPPPPCMADEARTFCGVRSP